MSLRAAAVVVAFALDRLFGEPPPRLHPVVWMGKALGATGAPWPRLPRRGQFLCGTLGWIANLAAWYWPFVRVCLAYVTAVGLIHVLVARIRPLRMAGVSHPSHGPRRAGISRR